MSQLNLLTPTEEIYNLIDETLRDLRGVSIAEAGKMTDILLDLRVLVDRVTSVAGA
jgi:hypothetical protein